MRNSHAKWSTAKAVAIYQGWSGGGSPAKGDFDIYIYIYIYIYTRVNPCISMHGMDRVQEYGNLFAGHSHYLIDLYCKFASEPC